MKLKVVFFGLFLVSGNAIAALKPCATVAEIDAHVKTPTPEGFCFHKVENPKVGLVSGRSIPGFNQLMPNLELAFLNTEKNFEEAGASCASLGAGWHAPVSSNQYANPRAKDNSNSLEAVGEYLTGSSYRYIWSSSTVSYNTTSAWDVNLADGTTDSGNKYDPTSVVCVRP
jgi:hypothetical protein